MTIEIVISQNYWNGIDYRDYHEGLILYLGAGSSDRNLELLCKICCLAIGSIAAGQVKIEY